MVEKAPSSGFAKFRETKIGMVVGMIIALAAGVLLFYAGAVEWCCIGTLFIAVAAFVILWVFGVKNLKALIVFAVLFFLVSTAAGGFLVSKNAMDAYSDTFNSAGFHDVTYSYDNGDLTVTVTYTGTQTLDEVDLYFGEVSFVCYRSFNYYGSGGSADYKHVMNKVLDTNNYTCTFHADGQKLYGFKITAKSGDSTFSTYHGVCKACISDSNYMIELIKLNSYYCALTTILFLAIVLFSQWSQRNMEKTKQKMIAEGKMPVGYGTCKNCGGLVVPGEEFCRKCGQKIEGVVPLPKKEQTEEKNVEYFECSDCGAKVPSDAKVCPKCGAKFDDDE